MKKSPTLNMGYLPVPGPRLESAKKGWVVEFEICFLNRRGDLSCSMRASFTCADHAARYARNVMETEAGRNNFRAAEVFLKGQPCARIGSAPPMAARPQIVRSDTIEGLSV